MDDHAVPIYKNSQSMNITFTISKYPSKTFGQFIRRLRVEKGLEQRELARKIRVHKNTIYEWENDRKNPSRMSKRRLAKFFRTSVKRLEDFKIES